MIQRYACYYLITTLQVFDIEAGKTTHKNHILKDANILTPEILDIT